MTRRTATECRTWWPPFCRSWRPPRSPHVGGQRSARPRWRGRRPSSSPSRARFADRRDGNRHSWCETVTSADDGVLSLHRMHPNVRRVADAARDLGIDIDVRTFPAGTKTAADAAAAIGVEVGQIVKSLIFAVDGEVVLAYVSGGNQLDERKLAALAGGRKSSRVDADAVRSATGYPIGGVPPFGHATELRAFVDEDLLTFDTVWAAAGTWNDVFPLTPDDLVRASNGRVGDLRRAPA